MAGRKQSDYLSDLLTDDDDTASADTAVNPSKEAPPSLASSSASRRKRASNMSLLGRESALARVASGEVRQVTRLKIDPAKTRIWKGNARIQERLTEETVRDLIDTIIAEGGQKVPATVRRITDDSGYDYEVIAGTRRHFAISWLRANSYPDMLLLAEVRDMDDEEAFRFADIENRARKDVSDIERARNYASALASHYGRKQRRMAERLKLSEGWLSKMLKVATLPDEVLEAFPDLGQLTLKPAYKLAQAVGDKSKATAVKRMAKKIAEENSEREQEGLAPHGGPAILSRLMAAGDKEDHRPALFAGTSRNDRPALSVTNVSRQGLTFKVHAASGADEEEMVALFREALKTHEYEPDGG